MSNHIFIRRKRTSGSLGPLSVINSARIAATTGSSLGITIPTVQDGDLLILQTYARDGAGGSCTISTPVGWTAVKDVSNVGATKGSITALYYKIATASMSGTVVTGGANCSTGSFRVKYKSLLVVRGGVAITSVAAGGINGEWNNGLSGNNPAAQTCTLSGATAPLIVIGSYGVSDTGAAVNPRTFTIGGVAAKDSELQETGMPDDDMWIAWKTFNVGDSLATPVVVDMVDNGSQMTLVSFYLQCA